MPSAHLQTRNAHLELLVADANAEWTIGAGPEKSELRVEVDVMAMTFECLAEVTRLLHASRHDVHTQSKT